MMKRKRFANEQRPETRRIQSNVKVMVCGIQSGLLLSTTNAASNNFVSPYDIFHCKLKNSFENRNKYILTKSTQFYVEAHITYGCLCTDTLVGMENCSTQTPRILNIMQSTIFINKQPTLDFVFPSFRLYMKSV